MNPTDPMTPVRALIAAHAEMGSHSNGDESQADEDMRWSKFMAASYNATASISQLLAEHDKVVALEKELRETPAHMGSVNIRVRKQCADRLAAIVEEK